MNEIEKHSKTWRTVAKRCEMELEAARLALEDPDMDEIKTAQMRGVIMTIRGILAMANPPPEPAKVPVAPKY